MYSRAQFYLANNRFGAENEYWMAEAGGVRVIMWSGEVQRMCECVLGK